MTASGNETEYDSGLRPADLDPERPQTVETPWGPVALYRIGDEVLAAESFCPHLQGPLFQGTLSGDEITCPWHQWRFSLRTGKRCDGEANGDARLRLFTTHLGPEGTLQLRPREPLE